MQHHFSELITSDPAHRLQLRNHATRLYGENEIWQGLSSALAPHQFELGGQRSSDIEVWHQCLDLQGIGLHYLDYHCDADLATVIVDQPKPGLMVKVPLSGLTLVRQNGKEIAVHPNEFTVFSTDAAFETVMKGNSRHLTLTFEEGWLRTYLARDGRGVAGNGTSFEQTRFSLSQDGYLLAGLITNVMSCLAYGEVSIRSANVQTHMKELITSVILELTPSYIASSQRQRTQDDVPGYVRRAERFITDHLTDAISIEDIVVHARTSRRTLHAGFRKYRGTSPMSYLKTLRLNAAKADLEMAGDDQNDITTIAMTYGFYHLGRFSRDFRDAFGFLPSHVKRHR